MLKWIVLIVILAFGGYTAYDSYMAGYLTRPEMPEGAFPFLSKTGFAASWLMCPRRKRHAAILERLWRSPSISKMHGHGATHLRRKKAPAPPNPWQNETGPARGLMRSARSQLKGKRLSGACLSLFLKCERRLKDLITGVMKCRAQR